MAQAAFISKPPGVWVPQHLVQGDLLLNFGTARKWDSPPSAGKGRREPRLAPGGGWSCGRQHIPQLESAVFLPLPGRMYVGHLQSWPRAATEFQPSMSSLAPKISVFGECHTTENSRLHHLPVQCQHWGHIKQDSNRLKSLEYKLTSSWGCAHLS